MTAHRHITTIQVVAYEKWTILALTTKDSHIETLQVLLAEQRPGRACKPAWLRSALHDGAFVSHNCEAVELLVEHGAPLDLVDGFNVHPSALSGAVKHCFQYIMPFLLKVGARPGETETPTPLERAIRTDQLDVVKILLEAGYRLADDNGLCTIAEQGNKALVQVFIDLGLDVQMCW
ncbi:hypothetical protein BDW59DRAFT_152561 [Aspergillus cavernicola]|uniref:Ankyrin repeat-containing domain protein n=1 Tax=Aspergillus cavernicola TaxID=176166 RepID=A0ABR4HPT2_9EURO